MTVHQPLDVRLGRIALIRRRLDPIDGQRRQNRRGAAEGLTIGPPARPRRPRRSGQRDYALRRRLASAVSGALRPTDLALTFFRRTAFFFAIRTAFYPPAVRGTRRAA